MNTTELKKPRGRPPAFDYDEALEKALQLFWAHGYEGTSMAELMQAMGINKTSIYAAYGNKEQLFRKALQRYLSGPAAYAAQALQEPSARDAVQRLLAESVTLLIGQKTPTGCLLVQGALSCGRDSVLIQQELTAYRARFEQSLRQRLEQAKADGELSAGTNAADLAKYICTVHQGLSIQAAGGASKEELMAVVRLALEHWPG